MTAANSWLSLLRSGTAALRPTTPDSVGPCFYYATDTAVLSVWTGAAWTDFGPMPSGIHRNANVAATGSTVTDAAAISAGFTVVTGADGTKGVVLPTAPQPGTCVSIKNNSASILKVWPDAAAAINAIGSHSDLAVAANTTAEFIADSATQWYSFPLLPS